MATVVSSRSAQRIVNIRTTSDITIHKLPAAQKNLCRYIYNILCDCICHMPHFMLFEMSTQLNNDSKADYAKFLIGLSFQSYVDVKDSMGMMLKAVSKRMQLLWHKGGLCMHSHHMHIHIHCICTLI